MRVTALAAAAVCIGLTIGGVASARPFNDPQGRVIFDNPSGWSTLVSRSVDQSQYSYLVTGTANNECQVAAIPNPTTAAHNPVNVRNQAADPTRFTNEIWVQSLSRFGGVFADPPTIQSTSVDTSGAWPIQRAEANNGERAVHAAMTFRPGVELVVMCLTYNGADPTSTYDAFIHSVTSPNDAQWAAALAASPLPAPGTTPAPAAASAPAAPAPQH